MRARSGARSGHRQGLLAFSRRQTTDARPLDLNEAIASLQHLLERLLGGGVEMRLCLEDGLPPVHADPTEIEQGC
jgi:C4-dicarboxylate-specific signal transduction histidine kinase